MSRVVSFPHMGDYAVAFTPIGELLGEVTPAPPITKATLEAGAAHSPEAACVPFKYTLGCMIEALDRGAEVVVMAGGGCRLGFYGEVQEAILRDMGYRFDLVALSNHSTSLRKLMGEFKRLSPHESYRSITRAFDLAIRRVSVLDELQDRMRREAAFAVDADGYAALGDDLLAALARTETPASAEEVRAEYRQRLDRVALERPARPLRVGIVGEVYVAIEPFSNHLLERMLSGLGVEVHREVDVSGIFDAFYGGRPYMRRLIASAVPYLSHDIGVDGSKSVAHTLRYMREGFDGVIHVKPFGCLPEVNALPALQRIAREHAFPVMSLSYDVHASEEGTRTRVEAYCDMLRLRRGARRVRAEKPASG